MGADALEDQHKFVITYDTPLKKQLDAWIEIAGEGDAATLVAELRDSWCFTNNELYNEDMEIHYSWESEYVAEVLLSEDCLTSDGADEAMSRYMTAFANNFNDESL